MIKIGILSNIENAIGSSSDDDISGNAQNNIIEGGNGNDWLNGGAGIDTVSYASATGAVSVNIGDSNAFNSYNNYTRWNSSTGSAGNDDVVGFENIIGSNFNGNDTIIGGLGNDVLKGGSGSDVFKFAANDGADIIKDFDLGLDKIDLSDWGISFDNLIFGHLTLDYYSAVSVSALDISNTITVSGYYTDINSLDASSFVFA